jgi:hypothetical protein
MEEHVVTMAARRKYESRSSSWGGLNIHVSPGAAELATP